MTTTMVKTAELSPEDKKGIIKIIRRVFFDIRPKDLNSLLDDYYALEYLKMIPSSETKNAREEFPHQPLMYFIIKLCYGVKVGLRGLPAIHNICVIHGKPCVYGDAVKGLIQSQSDYRGIESEYLEEEKGYKVTVYRAHTLGDGKEVVRAYEAVYTLKAAEKAGYLRKKSIGWGYHPLRMIELRATWYAAKGAYSDLLMGMNQKEEIEDYENFKGTEVKGVLQKDETQMEVIEALNNQAETLIMETSIPDLVKEEVPMPAAEVAPFEMGFKEDESKRV